jgi:putative transposase
MPLLTNDMWREKLSRCIEAASKESAIELVGFVFMPEHLHLLVYPTAPNPSISRYLARIKQPFSKQINDSLVEQGSRLLSKLTVLERPGKTCFRFWQEGPGFDRNLFSSDAIASSLDYIHNNPVNRGLCRCAVD